MTPSSSASASTGRLSRGLGLLLGAAALSFSLLACRGQSSEKPPVQPQRNMFQQPRYDAYDRSAFFADGRTLRHPPKGTVALGQLQEDRGFHTGFSADSVYVTRNPLPVDMAFLERGQERYNIYCSVCHGRTGAGNGVVVQRGFSLPPNFHEDRIVTMPDGQIYQTIANGVRTMPSYGKQIPEADRWAIVAYLRALQRSQRATLKDVPEEMRGSLQ